MAEPRTSSPGRNLPSFRKDSEKNPNGIPTPRSPHGHRVGYGMGTGREERPPFAERSAAEFAWAAEHLPAEHPGFVVVAMGMLRLNGQPVSRNSVLARLKATGRDRTAVNAQAKRLGQKEPLA